MVLRFESTIHNCKNWQDNVTGDRYLIRERIPKNTVKLLIWRSVSQICMSIDSLSLICSQELDMGNQNTNQEINPVKQTKLTK